MTARKKNVKKADRRGAKRAGPGLGRLHDGALAGDLVGGADDHILHQRPHLLRRLPRQPTILSAAPALTSFESFLGQPLRSRAYS